MIRVSAKPKLSKPIPEESADPVARRIPESSSGQKKYN
jgi:hypothetical protein